MMNKHEIRAQALISVLEPELTVTQYLALGRGQATCLRPVERRTGACAEAWAAPGTLLECPAHRL